MMVPPRDSRVPSAPPLSPSSGLYGATGGGIDVYALPVAQPVAINYAHADISRPPPRFSPVHDQSMRRSPSASRRIRSVQVDAQSGDGDWCPSAWPIGWFLLRLLAYHVVNIALGCLAAACVYTGLLLSIALLPLCGYGVVIFQVLLETTFYLCYMDARVHNWIADAKHAAIMFPDSSTVSEQSPLLPVRDPRSRHRVQAPQFDTYELHRVSARAVAAVVYFAAWKLLLVLTTVVLMVVWTTATVSFISDDADLIITVNGQPMRVLARWHWLVVVAVSSVALHLLGRVSQASTRFFCCRWRE